MDQELKIKISGDIDGLQKSIADATEQLDSFSESASSSAEQASSELEKAEVAAQSLERTFTVLANAPFSFGINAKKSSEEASEALSSTSEQLGRVSVSAEDAGRKMVSFSEGVSEVDMEVRELVQANQRLIGMLSSPSATKNEAAIRRYSRAIQENNVELERLTGSTRLNANAADALAAAELRLGKALSSSSQATKTETKAEQENTEATSDNTRAKKENATSTTRKAMAQRAALSATNNLSRATIQLATGTGNAAVTVTTLTRQLAGLAITSSSAAGGLSAIVSSLMGPAGIAIAASAAVTALMGYVSSKMASKRATDEAASANKTYIETLEGIYRTYAVGEQAASRDLTGLRLLYEATQNLTLPMEARRKAAEELISQYPKQLEGMSAEAVVAGKAASAYNQLTASITATAMAAANLDRIRENSAQILEKRLEMLDKQTKLNQLNAKIAREEASRPLPGAGVGQAGESIDAANASRLNRLYSQRAELMSDINKLGQDSGKIAAENTQLQNEYNKQILAGADLSGRLGTGLEAVGAKTKSETEKLLEALSANEAKYQISVREGRDKALEEVRQRYQEWIAAAKGNSALIIEIERQQAQEIDKLHRDWDKKDQQELDKLLLNRAKKIQANALKIRNQLSKEDKKAAEDRLREEQKLLRKLEQEQRRYARILGGELARAFEGFMTKGENVFKSLGDAFKRMIIRMVAEAAALKTIQFLQGSMGGGGKSGGFWNFLGGLFRFGSNMFSRSGYSSGSGLPSGNFGGGNFPTTNPIRGGGFAPGVMAAASPSGQSGISILRGNDIYMSNQRTIRLNTRFNGGQ